MKFAIANIVLRGLTLVSKFVLLFYLAKILPPEEIGVYGLFYVTISFSLFLLGLDYYAYAQREMHSRPKVEWPIIIRNQFTFYLLTYIFAIPILAPVFTSGILPLKYIGWFYVLVTLEHLSQELYRLLIAMQKPLLANLALFIRSGVWVYAVIVIMWLEPTFRDLHVVWAGWTIGALCSLLLTIFVVQSLDFKKLINVSIDWPWIRRGLPISLRFIIGTLAIRGLFTFDRYIIDAYLGKDSVAVYTVYIALINGITAFIDAGAISILYPKIVASYKQSKLDTYKKYIKKLAVAILFLSLLLNTLIGIVAYFWFSLFLPEIYTKNIEVLWLLQLMGVIMVMAYVPHYALYVRHKDTILSAIHIMSFVIGIVLFLIFIPKYGIIGAAIALIVSWLLVILLKSLFVYIYRE